MHQPFADTSLQPAEDSRKASTGMEEILAKLRVNDSRNVTPTAFDNSKTTQDGDFDKIISSLSHQNNALKQQGRKLQEDPRLTMHKNSDQSSTSGNFSESYEAVSSATSRGSEQAAVDVAEMARIKRELEAAKSLISRQEQELVESRSLKHTMDQAMGPVSEADFTGLHDISEQTIGHLQSAFNASARPFTSKGAGWRLQDDARSDSDFSAGSLNNRINWNQAGPSGLGSLNDYNNSAALNPTTRAAQAYAAMYGGHAPLNAGALPNRAFSTSSSSFGYDSRVAPDLGMYGINGLERRNSQLRSNSTLSDPLSLGSLAGVGVSSPPLSPLAIPDQLAYGVPRGVNMQQTPITPGFPAGQLASQGWSLQVRLYLFFRSNC
jgi:hypothetical protein